MKKEQLDQALALGLTTQEELKAFDIGYAQGQSDVYDEFMKDMKEIINEDIDEAFPSFAEDAIERHEEKLNENRK